LILGGARWRPVLPAWVRRGPQPAVRERSLRGRGWTWRSDPKEIPMKGILLWLIGIPIPIIILLYLFVF